MLYFKQKRVKLPNYSCIAEYSMWTYFLVHLLPNIFYLIEIKLNSIVCFTIGENKGQW